MTPVEVAPAPGILLDEPLRLLEESLRGGATVPESFAEQLSRAVEVGDVEVIAAREEGRALGVVLLAFRLSVSLGGIFASIEDLYVRPEARRRGVGRALLEAVVERCARRGVSYVEAQVEAHEAAAFYTALGYEAEPGVRVLSQSLPILQEQEADG